MISLEQGVSGSKLYSPMLTKEEWLESLARNKTYFIEVDGAIVGEISYEIKSPDHAYLDGLVVNPSFQGRGIARKVVEILLEELKGFREIDLVTHPENVKAVKLYESLGFKIESRVENYFGDGEPRIRLVLNK